MTLRSFLTSIIAILSFGCACAQQASQMQLPKMPDSITDTTQKYDYLVSHYWDHFDPHALWLTDSAACEETVAGYAWILHGTGDYGKVRVAFGDLMSRASANPDAYRMLCKQAKKYLYQPDSPFENLYAYQVLLQAISNDTVLSVAERERNKYTLECIEAVSQGQMAPNFTLPDGRDLYFALESKLGLLVFYDHDCDECQELLATIEKSAYIKLLIDEGSASVILVDMAADDVDPRTDGYLMRSFPSVYPLLPDGSILLPDTNLKNALTMIAAAQLAEQADGAGLRPAE